MSAAYTGVTGGLVVIVADDPGPHSSQTEQDTRVYAFLAKVPVLDPRSPEEAREFTRAAFDLSERYQLPVIVRPTTRVCHARQDMVQEPFMHRPQKPLFARDPSRWAATPAFRFHLHVKLHEKIEQISQETAWYPSSLSPHPRPWGHPAAPVAALSQHPGPAAGGGSCVVASGVACAHAEEILAESGLLEKVELFSVPMPYPLPPRFRDQVLARFARVLVLEETYPLIELQFQNRDKVSGRLTGMVPNAGELLPETVEAILRRFLRLPISAAPQTPAATVRRPTLCAGCPHRAAFYAIKKVFPKGIYPSDIGCYTLGLNLGAVDTVLCMGAAISQASGFYHAFRDESEDPLPIVATIGDSTFLHAGIPALINAAAHNARFVLVILDNGSTAMTGNQPTVAAGRTLDGQPAPRIRIEELVQACGVSHVRQGDPYELKAFTELLADAGEHARADDGGIAVVIAEHPCLMDRSKPRRWPRREVRVNEKCTGCDFCVKQFECPALEPGRDKAPVRIDPTLCVGCGVCVDVCPHGALHCVA
jgi:indolepyruvate ferredoxin oxidoreductase alpha subunit